MLDVDISDARTRLDELVERALAGEAIRIVEHGRALVQLTAVEQPRQPVDRDRLRALTAVMPRQPESAATAIRRMRDEERY